MTAPTPVTPSVSQADLRCIYREMCITVPFEQLSPLLLRTLTAVARAQLYRHAQQHQQLAPQTVPGKPRSPLKPLTSIDLKRRAAGDFDESD